MLCQRNATSCHLLGPPERVYEDQTNSIIIVNPDKRRMRPPPSATAGSAAAAPPPSFPSGDAVTLWRAGAVNSTTVVRQAGGGDYVYRYVYNGAGATTAWLSRHDYLYIDLSAGPTVFGPVASPTDPPLVPVSMPSLSSLYVRMMAEVEGAGQGTGHEVAAHEVAAGQHNIFTGVRCV